MNEQDTVRSILDGDESAQAAFVSEYRQKLYRTAVAVLGYQDPEAEDVVQNVFESAWKRLSDFDFKIPLASWLNRLCVMYCLQRWRQRKRQYLSSLDDLEKRILPETIKRKKILDEDERKVELIEGLRGAIDSMADSCNRILSLRHFQGQSYAQIAEELKISMGTVMSRLSRCLDKLKTMVTGKSED